MKHFLRWGLALIFCGSLQVVAQPAADPELVDYTLARANQFKINNQNDSALYELITLNRTLKELGQESGYVYVDIGNIYFQLRLDNMARKFYRKAQSVFLASRDDIGLSIVLENFGNLFSRTDPGSDSAHYYFSNALALQRQANDIFYAAHSQRALALYFVHRKQYAEAHQLIRQAIRTVNDPAIRQHPRYRWDVQFIPQQVLLTASDIYRAEKARPDSAEYFLKEAIRMTQVHGIDAHRVRYLTFLAIFYMEQAQWPKAFDAIEQSLQLAEQIGYVWGKVGALQAKRNYYHQTKDAKKEAEAGYEYLLYKDQMYNERNTDDLIVMSNLILQYENELEIERQQNLVREKEKINQYQKQQNLLLLAILGVVAGALLGVWVLYRRLQKQNQLVRQYSADLESSNETMRTLLSVISHDVRSPFNSLLGLSKVTLMEKELNGDDYRQRITMMHDTSAKGLILLDNLLQWVALQRDKTLLKKEPVAIEAVIAETLHELSGVALTQHVGINKKVEEATLHTDRNALKTVVRNLLTNAIKYSGGKVVFVEARTEDSRLVVRVTDQGPGIAEEQLAHLFAKADMKKVAAKGSGLGLQIVKQLVEQLGGQLQARNLAQGGAQFEVTLPLS
jgi:signal transduction histidine kinase